MKNHVSQSRNTHFQGAVSDLFTHISVYRRSLRFQLTSSILLILVPGFLSSAFIINRIAIGKLRDITHARMATEANLISFAIRRWADSNRQTLRLIASQESLRSGNIKEINELFGILDKLYPNREWRYWSAGPSPRLLAYTGGNVTAERVQTAQKRILERPYFREALQGKPGYAVINSFASGESCLMFAHPIYNQPVVREPAPNPSGVLLSCILLKNLSLDTHLHKTIQEFTYLNNSTIKNPFSSLKPLTSSLMIVSNQGHVLFPSAEYSQTDSIPLLSSYKNTIWWPLFSRVIASRANDTTLDSLTIGKDSYLIAASTADYQWSTVLVVNDGILYAELYHLRLTLFLASLLSLALVVVAIQYNASRIVLPIQLAGRALKRISGGDFDTQIPHSLSDEVGELLSNINATSLKLKQFLASETSHASTKKQLETAREIQKDFLPQDLPSSDFTNIAALCIPAYEVGADWYDAIRMNSTVYFIVADVCDKGIPSALYMSVFRTLTRHLLIQGMTSCDDSGSFLENVIGTVNTYMVANHGQSAMFATMFLGALDEQTGALTYVLAGHEPPLIISPLGMKRLTVSGPAVGLFSESQYTSHSLVLDSGSYLLAYTDGLIDARSSTMDSWGPFRFEMLSDYVAAHTPSSQDLVEWIVDDVNQFTQGVDQFDDLTLLAIRWTGSSRMAIS